MRKDRPEDTISAIATPLGEGGLGIVRLSGPDVLPIIFKIFKPQTKTRKLESHKIRLGIIENPATGKPIDKALVAYMKAPKSYTGEDVVEISCHGGTAVLKAVLSATLSSGARLAQPGEFTKRAFLNGRLDLSQAEAVIDLIKAKTPECAAAAGGQLLGGLSSKIKEIRGKLLKLLAGIEASIDFPDDVEGDAGRLEAGVAGIRDEVKKLLKTSDAGMMLKEGIPTVILGRPNVGKSSLLNALLKHDRAIVSPEPGTTRDTIEETANVKGLPLLVVDTAGIREASAPVEKAGVDRARDAASRAGLLIVVIDASEPLTAEDELVLCEAKGKRAIVALNKTDMCQKIGKSDVKKLLPDPPVFKISALYGTGIPQLEEGIFNFLLSGAKLEEDTMVMNLRHKNCLIRALGSLNRAGEIFSSGREGALAAIDLKEATAALGEISGEAVSEEVIDMIFSEFCVGK